MHGIINHLPRVSWLTAMIDKLATAWRTALRFVGAALRIQHWSSTTAQYPLTYEQQGEKKKAFVESIDQDAILRLASRYNGHRPCQIFRTSNGSFNACFFVEFPHDDTRWVVRIPIDSTVHSPWAKVRGEVATMRYIALVVR